DLDDDAQRTPELTDRLGEAVDAGIALGSDTQLRLLHQLLQTGSLRAHGPQRVGDENVRAPGFSEDLGFTEIACRQPGRSCLELHPTDAHALVRLHMWAQLLSMLIGKGLHPRDLVGDDLDEHDGRWCAPLAPESFQYGFEQIRLVGNRGPRRHQQSPPRTAGRCANNDCAPSAPSINAVRPGPMSPRTLGTTLTDLLMTAR